jgi:hypothetical protein
MAAQAPHRNASKTKKPPTDFSGGGSCFVAAISGETNS